MYIYVYANMFMDILMYMYIILYAPFACLSTELNTIHMYIHIVTYIYSMHTCMYIHMYV